MPIWYMANDISEDKKRVVINLYESGIGEEFIAMQLDMDIPAVISVLKESNIYKEWRLKKCWETIENNRPHVSILFEVFASDAASILVGL